MGTLDSRPLQRKYNLPQSTAPNKMLEHEHALFDEKIYIFGGGFPYTYDVLGATEYGNTFNIDPFSIPYAVKAEVFLTCEFTPILSGENFYIEFALRNDEGNDISVSSVTEGVAQSKVFPYKLDVSDTFIRYFQIFRDGNAYIRVMVSNSRYPLYIYGAYLKITSYRGDTYGDYATPFSQALISTKIKERKRIQGQINTYQNLPYLLPITPK